MKKQVIILGSTGSIGRSTLAVLDGLTEAWEIVGLAAGSRATVLADQANRYRPAALAIADESAAEELHAGLEYEPVILRGVDSLTRLVDRYPCHCVVSGVVGTGGLAAIIRAVELGRRIALANKETLVIAGQIIMSLAERSGAMIIPVDSEHSAIFQAMQAGRPADVRMVYLTASGGPFRTWTTEALRNATVEDALSHPTWNMGPKTTIDSATMMNKALEVVEARWLFGLRADQISVVIHPESIIHSVVEYCDGSMIAQMSSPDMRTPIQYALSFPERWNGLPAKLDLVQQGRLSFEAPDMERFPGLRLGFEAANHGGTWGAVMNAANEVAVSLFRRGRMAFSDIAQVTESVMRDHPFVASPTLEQLMEADSWARGEVARCSAC